MNKRTLAKFRKLYETERTLLTRKISMSEDFLDADGDETDVVQAKTLAKIQNALSAREISRLEKIGDAIKKIDDGTFGECEECGDPIGEKRLEAIPGVSTCIVCAEIEEKEAKNFAAMVRD